MPHRPESLNFEFKENPPNHEARKLTLSLTTAHFQGFHILVKNQVLESFMMIEELQVRFLTVTFG